MPFAPLIATLLALACGPLLYAAARRSPATLSFLDGFVLVSIAGLVVLEVVPGTFSEGGAWSIAFLALGLFGPTLLEHAFRHAQRQAHIATLVLAVSGLVLHALADGVVLAPGQSGDWALPLAVVLHSVPVGMAVWWLLAPSFGPLPPLLALIAMGVGTITGFNFGLSLSHLMGAQAWAWLQSLVAGSILHVVFGKPHLHENHEPEHTHAQPATSPFEGVGNLAALAAVAIISLFHTSAATENDVFQRFLYLAMESAPALLLAYVIGGFLYGELPDKVIRWLSKGGRTSQALRGTLLGLPLPVCSCSVLPLYHTLAQRGTPPAAALAFLISAPEVGLTALLVSLPLLGLEMTLVRIGAAAILAMIVALLVARWAKAEISDAKIDDCCAHEPPKGTRVGRALRAGLVDLVDGTAPWILLGLVIAAASEPLLRQMLWTNWPDYAEVLLFAVLGMPLYVCAAGATPLIAVLIAAGVSPGAALAFLLTGPATNIATFGVLRKLHGARLAWIFAICTATGAVVLGMAVNELPLSLEGIAGVEVPEPSVLQQLSLLGLALLYAASLVRKGARGFVAELAETARPA